MSASAAVDTRCSRSASSPAAAWHHKSARLQVLAAVKKGVSRTILAAALLAAMLHLLLYQAAPPDVRGVYGAIAAMAIVLGGYLKRSLDESGALPRRAGCALANAGRVARTCARCVHTQPRGCRSTPLLREPCTAQAPSRVAACADAALEQLLTVPAHGHWCP